jgi:hypothetical protein
MCFAALALASGTTSADVVMSQSNNPTALMTDQLSSVMSIEREAFKAIAPVKVRRLAKEPRKLSKREPETVDRFDPSWLAALPKRDKGEPHRCLAGTTRTRFAA